jgi:hypothetical protein
MSVALSIVFTGLCALVGSGDGRPGEVLLVDAAGVGKVGGTRFPAHSAVLVVGMAELTNPDTSGAAQVVTMRPTPRSRLEQVGVWPLAGTEVRIRVQGEEVSGLRYFSPAEGESSWPKPPRDVNEPAAWRDPRYVPNMKVLVGEASVDRALLASEGTEPRPLPAALAARVVLEGGLVQGGLPSQETYRDDLYVFQGATAAPAIPQALTDTLEWTLESQAAAVVIEIAPLDGGPVKRLAFAPSAKPHQVFISNLPAANAVHADGTHEASAHDMVAAHFAAYYALLENAPPDRPLPRLFEAQAAKGTGMLRPAKCFPVVFSRQ